MPQRRRSTTMWPAMGTTDVVQKTLFSGILSHGIGSWAGSWKMPRAGTMGTMSVSWELNVRDVEDAYEGLVQ